MNLFFRIFGSPFAVVLGQTALLVFAWGFFATVQQRGSISLSYDNAAFVQNYPRPVTLLVTSVSTVLSNASTFLFACSLQYAVTLHLYGPGMLLSKFATVVALSSRSIINDIRRWKWALASGVVIFLIGIQVSAWNTLLTPTQIFIPVPVTARELNLTSPDLRALQSNGELEFCIRNSTMLPAFSMGLTGSGFALLEFDRFNSSLTVMDQTFDAETWGILPMTVVPLDSRVWFPNTTAIPSGFQLESLVNELPDGLDATYNMTQQGFTVYTECQFEDPDTASSSVTLVTASVAEWSDDGNQDGNITFSKLNANCDVPIIGSSTAYTLGDEANYILMVGCVHDTNYTLTFRSSGKYDFLKPTSCTVTPLIIPVIVNYTDVDPFEATINATITTDLTQLNGSVPEDSLGPAGRAAVFAMQQLIYSAQGVSRNVMGDQLQSFLEEFDDGDQFNQTDILKNLELYIDAVAEYSGTVMRACISASNEIAPNGIIPDNLATNSSGFFLIRTFGWQHTSTAAFALIPVTLIAGFSILVVLSTALKYWSVPYTRLNPADPLQLMAASAAGGLDPIFYGGLKEGNLEARVDVPIFLQTIPGRGPVMVTQENRNLFVHV